MSPWPASSTRQIPTRTTPELGVNRTRRRLLADARERMAGERRLFTLRADLTSADRTAPTRHHRAGAVRTPVNELVDYRPVMSTVNEGDEIPTVPTGTGWPQPAGYPTA